MCDCLTPYQRALKRQQRRVADDMRRRMGMQPVTWPRLQGERDDPQATEKAKA